MNKHDDKIVISVDATTLIDTDKTPIKEKKKMIKVVLKNEIERLSYLNRMGYYQSSNGLEDIAIIQRVYHDLLNAIDDKSQFKKTKQKTALINIWEKAVLKELSDIKLLKSKYNEVKGKVIINQFLKRLLFQIERMFLIARLPYGNNCIIETENLSFYHINNLPSNIKEIKTSLYDSKMKYYIESSGINYHNNSIDVIEKNNKYCDDKNKYIKIIMDIKLGLELNHISDIDRIKNKKVVETILIRAEKLYISQNFIVRKEDRMNEYHKIIKEFPGKEIILVMPEQRILYEHLGIEEDAYLHPHILSRHYAMYEMELYCINEIAKDYRVKVVFPSVVNDQDYIFYKQFVKTGLNLYPNKKLLEVGIIVDNDVIYEYMDYYKPFDFLILDTQKLYSELYEETEMITLQEFKEGYINETREIHQHARIRKKPDYILGDFLNNKAILLKTLKMGFRSFIITTDYINAYDKMITEYLAGKKS